MLLHFVLLVVDVLLCIANIITLCSSGGVAVCRKYHNTLFFGCFLCLENIVDSCLWCTKMWTFRSLLSRFKRHAVCGTKTCNHSLPIDTASHTRRLDQVTDCEQTKHPLLSKLQEHTTVLKETTHLLWACCTFHWNQHNSIRFMWTIKLIWSLILEIQ